MHYSTKLAKSTLTQSKTPRKRQFPLSLAVMAMALPAVGIAGVGITGWFLNSHSPSGVTKSESDVYVAYQLNTSDSVKLATYLNYDLSRNLNPEQRLNVDVLRGRASENVYSSMAEQTGVQQLNQYFHLLPSDDTALLQAVQRVANLVKQKG